MVRKVLGIVIALFAGLMTLKLVFWPLTGNHGATWSQFVPYIVVSGGVTAFGVYLAGNGGKLDSQDKSKESP